MNSKIVNAKKVQIRECMRIISARFMHRGNRYRIIELLTELNVPQEVFDICIKEYSLLLSFANKDNVKKLAEKVEPYSVELAMVLMMSTDGSIRDCLWREKYRELIGKDAIKKFLRVPGVDNPEITVELQKEFLREMPGSKVRINLDDEIAGNEEAIQGMIRFDKKYNPIFDISLKPDYGVYFARIKYVDQYVNWYKNTHDKNYDMHPEKRAMMQSMVRRYYEPIMCAFDTLSKDKKLKEMATLYKTAVNSRCKTCLSKTVPNCISYPLYFVVQGLAAFLAKLPANRTELDELRAIGIGFMSSASVLAPRLSQRDILMAATYIYLKRKEETLCR